VPKKVKGKLISKNKKQEGKKGKRGKKICPVCDEYVPIHSSRCHKCRHEFMIKHKPRKIKEPSTGETYFSLFSIR
jgi:hypothetical protein